MNRNESECWYEDVPIETIEALNAKMDELIDCLDHFEHSLCSLLRDWTAETRRARKKFQAEFFPEKTVAM